MISPIERKTWSGRILSLTMYVILLLGSVTTVYPFLLMLRLSTADATDKQSLSVVPGYWVNQDALAKKYILRKHGRIDTADPEAPDAQPTQGPEWTNSSFRTLPNFWRQTFGEFESRTPKGLARQRADYASFMQALSPLYFESVAWHYDGTFETFQARQRRQHPERPASQELFLVQKDLATRDWHPQWDENWTASTEYLSRMPAALRTPCQLPWVQFLKDKYGQFEVNKLNQAWGSNYRSWTEVQVPLEPLRGVPAADYRAFVTTRYPHIWTKVVGDFGPRWQAFLAQEKHLTPEQWRTLTGQEIASIQSIPWTESMPENDGWATLWSEFVHRRVPYANRQVTSPDLEFSRFLRRKYGRLEALGQAWGAPQIRWGSLTQCERLNDYWELTHDSAAISRGLTFSPYQRVLQMLAGESQALTNTALLVLLSLIAALTVNPLAAYALSRFNLRGSQRVLLFFLATMALPAEIALVPSFLLVRDLGLMNSYMALILPGAASGFGIFLLKGFFDSLPQELFEAATLDGAKEMTIFARITMPLAQPILAVTALGAVLGAYGTFLGAVLYLPDVSKWPLMPRLYELTSNPNAGAPYAVAMAGLVVATLPTLLIFLFAQRMIMRGIVLPSLK